MFDMSLLDLFYRYWEHGFVKEDKKTKKKKKKIKAKVEALDVVEGIMDDLILEILANGNLALKGQLENSEIGMEANEAQAEDGIDSQSESVVDKEHAKERGNKVNTTVEKDNPQLENSTEILEEHSFSLVPDESKEGMRPPTRTGSKDRIESVVDGPTDPCTTDDKLSSENDPQSCSHLPTEPTNTEINQ